LVRLLPMLIVVVALGGFAAATARRCMSAPGGSTVAIDAMGMLLSLTRRRTHGDPS